MNATPATPNQIFQGTTDREAIEHLLNYSEPEYSVWRAYAAHNGTENGTGLAVMLPTFDRLRHRIEIDQVWTDPLGVFTLQNALAQQKYIAVTGAMGTGKTTAILAACAGLRVCYVAPTRALTDARVKQIPNACVATDVVDVRKGALVTRRGDVCRSVVVCPPSLGRIAAAEFDVIILDEACSLMRFLHLSEVCGKHDRALLITQLNTLIERAKAVVALDANLNVPTLLAIKKLTWYLMNSKAKPLTAHCTLLHGKRQAAVERLIKNIKTNHPGGRYVVHVDSTVVGELMQADLALHGIPAIVIHADNKWDACQGSFMTRSQHFWTDYPGIQVVITTSTLGSGFSIEGNGAAPVAEVWGIFTGGNGQTPDDYAQALFRVRSGVPRYLWIPRRCSGNAYGLRAGNYEAEQARYIAAQQQHEQTKLRDYVAAYILFQGCSMSDERLPEPSMERASLAAVRARRSAAIANATPISEGDAAAIATKARRHSIEQQRLIKHTWESRMARPLTDAEWTIATAKGTERKFRYAAWLLDPEATLMAAMPDDQFETGHVDVDALKLSRLFQEPETHAGVQPLIQLIRGEHTDATGEGTIWRPFNDAIYGIGFAVGAHPDASPQEILALFLRKLGIKRKRRKRSGNQGYDYILDTDHMLVWRGLFNASADKVKAVISDVALAIKLKWAQVRQALNIPAMEHTPVAPAEPVPEPEVTPMKPPICTAAEFEALAQIPGGLRDKYDREIEAYTANHAAEAAAKEADAKALRAIAIKAKNTEERLRTKSNKAYKYLDEVKRGRRSATPEEIMQWETWQADYRAHLAAERQKLSPN